MDSENQNQQSEPEIPEPNLPEKEEGVAQNGTIQHERQNSLVADLSKHQRMAVIWRTEGISFQEIADNLNLSIFTVKNWFRVGTSTYAVYKDHSGEIGYQLGMEAINRMRLLVGKATDVLEESLSKNVPLNTRLRAATYLLDRTTEMTLEEKEVRDTFPQRYDELLSIIGLSREDLCGENRGEALMKLDYYMGLLDEMKKYI